jgi:hypothetical protein
VGVMLKSRAYRRSHSRTSAMTAAVGYGSPLMTGRPTRAVNPVAADSWGWRSRFRSDVDQHSELKPIGITAVVRNTDRHGIGTAAQGSLAADSTGKWRIPAATEKADHAQVEGSTAAPFPRDEPASDRPQLFGLAKHGSRLRFRRPVRWRNVAAARRLG